MSDEPAPSRQGVAPPPDHLSPGRIWVTAPVDPARPRFVEALEAEREHRRAGKRDATTGTDRLLAAVETAHAAGAAWLDLELKDIGRIVVVWPSAEPLLEPDASLVDDVDGYRPRRLPTVAQIAQGAREPLPWDHYAPELRDELKALAVRFRPDAIADAAIRLAELIALHGPPRARGVQNGAST